MSFDDLEAGRLLFGRPASRRRDQSQAVVYDVFRISTAVRSFERLVSDIGTYKDTHELRYKLHKQRAQIGVLVKDTSTKFQQASQVMLSKRLYSDGIINYDGHTEPLLAVQFTVLADGFFVGCSFNHSVADGTSYWNFFNAWASIARGEVTDQLTSPPVHERWFMDGDLSSSILMPFQSPDELIERFSPAPFQETFFHFSAQSIAELKAKANGANGSRNYTISSLQSVISLVWRAIVRARKQPDEEETSAKFTIEARSRLPLSPSYFGNAINVITPSTTVGELLGGGLEWGATLAHEAISEHTADVIRESYIEWLEKPKFSKMSLYEDGRSVMLSSSPRFKMYECDFGYGKAVAVRSGIGAKFDGKVWLYPGREGGGSMDLEICLAPEHMKELERDEEFATATTLG